jgi:hypothetical protein
VRPVGGSGRAPDVAARHRRPDWQPGHGGRSARHGPLVEFRLGPLGARAQVGAGLLDGGRAGFQRLAQLVTLACCVRAGLLQRVGCVCAGALGVGTRSVRAGIGCCRALLRVTRRALVPLGLLARPVTVGLRGSDPGLSVRAGLRRLRLRLGARAALGGVTLSRRDVLPGLLGCGVPVGLGGCNAGVSLGADAVGLGAVLAGRLRKRFLGLSRPGLSGGQVLGHLLGGLVGVGARPAGLPGALLGCRGAGLGRRGALLSCGAGCLQLGRGGVRPTHTSDRKRIDHPEVGALTLDCDVFTVQGSDLRVIAYTAEPGSGDADKLALLRVIGLQELSGGTRRRSGR